MHYFTKTVIVLFTVGALAACVPTNTRKEDGALPTHPPAATDTDAQAAVSDKEQPAGPLKPFSWLEGCWKGSVNQREYREHWLPLRGNMLLGASHTVFDGKTQDYQFLRMEVDGEDVYYVIAIPEQKEFRFKLAGETTEDKDTIFTFSNVADAFPQTIVYRHASGGWLYIHIEGTHNGKPHQVIYPIRHIDCGSGEFLAK